jgi:hypothetical protein
MNAVEYAGLRFAVAVERDDDSTPPWENEDGHGAISDWQRRERTTDGHVKAPYERILCDDGRNYCSSVRVYDMRESMRIAKREGWGLGPDELAALAKRLGRAPKTGDVLAESVERDYQRMRAWCNDEWFYVGVVVTLQDVDGNDTPETESIWGIESDSEDYLAEVAQELAQRIADRVGNACSIPARPAQYFIRTIGARS